MVFYCQTREARERERCLFCCFGLFFKRDQSQKCHLRVFSLSLCRDEYPEVFWSKPWGLGERGWVLMPLSGLLVTRKLTSHTACLLSLPPPQKVSWEFNPQPPPHPKGISGLRFYGLKSQEMAKFWSRVIYKPGMLGEGAGSFK